MRKKTLKSNSLCFTRFVQLTFWRSSVCLRVSRCNVAFLAWVFVGCLWALVLDSKLKSGLVGFVCGSMVLVYFWICRQSSVRDYNSCLVSCDMQFACLQCMVWIANGAACCSSWEYLTRRLGIVQWMTKFKTQFSCAVLGVAIISIAKNKIVRNSNF